MSCDAGKALQRLVSATFGTFRGGVEVSHLMETAWASVTFAGARHRLRIALDGDGAAGAAADFRQAMPELDLPIPGHIVADLALAAEHRSEDGRHACLEVEALTVEDC